MRIRKNGLAAKLLASAFRVAWLAAPAHWGDVFIAEESRVRQRMLKLYARFEVQLLAFFYWLLGRDFMSNPWVRKFFYYALAKFMAERAIVSQVMTLGEMEEFIRELPDDGRIAVGPCRCRLATGACDHPLETDIVILTGAPIWLELFPRDYRVIDKEEALRIVRESNEKGLVQMLDRHMYFRGSANYFVICNCCACSCLPIIGYRVFKQDGYHYIPSRYRSTVDPERCQGCGTCVEVCAFRERSLVEGRARVADCQGCGLCVRFCPHRANTMVPRREACPL
ncbi:4Fe-4S binding protein [Candidatus Solincola sp.]|nr:4Fe-4S binding protein [Actinomycetota bacterium]MDI7251938.1 4Fe-4S binding protein [Actinomycetota bacterium]